MRISEWHSAQDRKAQLTQTGFARVCFRQCLRSVRPSYGDLLSHLDRSSIAAGCLFARAYGYRMDVDEAAPVGGNGADIETQAIRLQLRFASASAHAATSSVVRCTRVNLLRVVQHVGRVHGGLKFRDCGRTVENAIGANLFDLLKL